MIARGLKAKDITQTSKILYEAYYNSIVEAKNFLKKMIKTSFVAVDKNEVLGVLVYAKGYSHHANYIEDIVVSKKHRRKGVATILLKKYIEVSRKETPKKQKYALSSTDITNKASIKMHKKFGFKELGRIKKLHYGKDEIFYGFNLRNR